jgi:hypothetical protein
MLSRLARRVLPARVRAPLARIRSFPRAYWTARRVSTEYSRQYADAQRQYRADGHVPAQGRPSLGAVGVRTLGPGAPSNLIALPPSYGELVGRIQRNLSERLSWSANSWFHPPPAQLAARTDDVEEVRRGDVIIIKLRDHLNIDGLEDLCAELIPEVERAIFGSYVLVDKVYVYRTLVSRRRDQGSWLWHFDQHPLEVLKLMIYLTDVGEDTAPFTYLSAGGTGDAVMGTRHPLYSRSRIPASVMEAHIAKGCRVRPVTGPCGTAVVFNDNVIHRATFAERRHRDVIVLQLRPATERRLPYVHPAWTGSWQHRDFNADPRQVEPQPGPIAHRA